MWIFLRCSRSLAAEISQRHARDVEEKNRELAERVAAATMDQIRAKLEADFEELKKHVPSAEKEAVETALDMKYLQERQMTLVEQLLCVLLPACFKSHIPGLLLKFQLL